MVSGLLLRIFHKMEIHKTLKATHSSGSLVKQWEVGKTGQPNLPEEEEVWGIGLHLKGEKSRRATAGSYTSRHPKDLERMHAK